MRRASAIILAIVVVAGGVVAVGGGEPADAATTRIAGIDRFATANQVSQAMPASTGGVVFLANGQDFPDALAAAPVVAAERGRLLLVSSDAIPASTVDEIRRLQPREIVLVGGEPTLSPAVAAQAATLAPAVERIAGAGRVETSMLLLDRMRRTAQPTQLWIVSGSSFPDALAAGAVAARLGHGLVLTTGATPDFESQLASRIGGITRISIAGGQPSVPQAVQDVAARYASVERFAGSGRYETSYLINARFTTSAAGGRMVLASGEQFPDGLVGSVLASRLGQPLYIVPSRCLTDDLVAREVTRLGIRDTLVIGGTPSVSDASARLERCVDVPASAADVIRIANDHRAMIGAPPLVARADLMAMAGRWSSTMAQQQSMVHSTTFCDETFRMGFRRCAENIARTGSPSAQGVMNAWMNSAPHRANILNPRLTHIGVGLAQGPNGWYWTQNFGGY